MSSLIDPKFVSLEIDADEEYANLVKLTLFNSESQIVNENSRFAPLTLNLPRGLYSLKLELSGQINNTPVILDRPTRFHIGSNFIKGKGTEGIDPPKLITSATFRSTALGEYKTTHEYYSDPVCDWSKDETVVAKHLSFFHPKPTSSLFIFLRFTDKETFVDLKKKSESLCFNHFSLYDRFGNLIADFQDNESVRKEEEKYGWMAFNCALESGLYFLKYAGQNSRFVPIYVYNGWHTQVFLTVGLEPYFGSLRIFLSEKKQFDPDDRKNKYLDIFLDKLQNDDFSLTKELVRVIANDKFQSPMLGLLGAYCYLQSNDEHDDNLFHTIVDNLQNVILSGNSSAPDLRALNLMAHKKFKDVKVKKTRVLGTPMYRVGFDAIRRASTTFTRLITKNSINDYVTENYYSDSPFNTFQPIPFEKERFLDIKLIKDEFGEVQKELDKLKFSNLREIYNTEYKKEKEKMEARVSNLLGDRGMAFIQFQENPVVNNSWIKNTMSSMLIENPDLTVKQLSESMQISGSTVNRIIQEWKSDAKKST